MENPIDRRRLLCRAEDLKNQICVKNCIIIVSGFTKAQQVNDKKLREEVREVKRRGLGQSGVVGVKIWKDEVVRGKVEERCWHR